MCKNLLLLIAIAALPALASAAAVTIRVIDFASVPQPVLRKALVQAEDIYRLAGIETNWVPCSPPVNCTHTVSEMDLVVKIIPRSMEAPNSREPLGGAMPERLLAFVFFHRIQESRLARHYPESSVLGAVLAHETGHLLGLEHSLSGIMRGTFYDREMQLALTGLLTFDANEAQQIRHATSLDRPAQLASTQVSQRRPDSLPVGDSSETRTEPRGVSR